MQDQNITLQDGTQLDPKIVKVMKTIKQLETGGSSDPYNAVGDQGDARGAYQFNEKTGIGWKGYAKKYLGDANAPMTPGNQNKAMYYWIKEQKDKGLQPSEIDALHNGARKDPSGTYVHINQDRANKFNSLVQSAGTAVGQGTDSSGYMTQPTFSPQFQQQMQQIKEGTIQPQEPGFTQELSSDLLQRLQQAGGAISGAASGQINPLSGILQTAGAGAGAVSDVVGDILKRVPVVGSLLGLVGKGVGKLAETAPGQAVVGEYQKLKQEHPEVAANIESIGNIASLIPIAEGAGAVKGAIKGTIGKALGRDVISTIASDIAPELRTATQVGKAVTKRGTTLSKLTGRIGVAEDPMLSEAAQAINEASPKFTQLKTYTQKLNAIDDGISKYANDLRSNIKNLDVQPILTSDDLRALKNEIGARIASPEGRLLVGDAGNRAQAIFDQFTEFLPKGKDITMDDVLTARQKLDNWIQAQRGARVFDPNSENAISLGLKATRQGINNLLDTKVPDANVKALLRKQSLLYKAAENITPKVAREVGTTRFSRFAGRHPLATGLLKGAAKTAGIGLASGLGMGAVTNYLRD